MRLYLIRHAHAVSEQENPSRPLSPRGRLDAARLAAWFRANHAFAPARLWHSPLDRARETAAILVRELAFDAVVVETPGLLPEDDPAAIAARIDAVIPAPADNLALVGHEPHLSALATLLVRGRRKPAAFDLKKCGVIALEPAGDVHKRNGLPRWLACWHVSPELFP